MTENNDLFEKTIVIEDPILEAYLNYKNVQKGILFTDYVTGKPHIKYTDTQEVRDAIKEYQSGDARVEPSQFQNILGYNEYITDSVSKEMDKIVRKRNALMGVRTPIADE